MSASSETEEQASQPRKASAHIDFEPRKGYLSKISGGGVGTLIVWAADRFHFTDDQRLIAGAVATWVAVGIGWAGPGVADEILRLGKYLRARFFLKQLDTLAASDPNDPVIAAKAREVRQTIADLLADGAKKFNKIKKT